MRRLKALALALVMTVSSVFMGGKVYANLNGGSFESAPPGGGYTYYDEHCQGLRFSLVDSDMNTLASFDAVNNSNYFWNGLITEAGWGHNIPYYLITNDFFQHPWYDEDDKVIVFSQSKAEVLKTGLKKAIEDVRSLNIGSRIRDEVDLIQIDMLPPWITANPYKPRLVATPSTPFVEMFKERFFTDDGINNGVADKWEIIFSKFKEIGGFTYFDNCTEPNDYVRSLASNDLRVLVEPVFWVHFGQDDASVPSAKIYGTVTEILAYANDCGDGSVPYDSLIKNHFAIMQVGAASMHLIDTWTDGSGNKVEGIFQKCELTSINGISDNVITYIINNMGVIVFDRGDFTQLSAAVDDYSYRAGTDVVTSIKIVNNNSTAYLPTQEEIDRSSFEGRNPVALKAEITFLDDSNNVIPITEIPHPEYVTLECIAGENDKKERGATYMYFKWHIPDIDSSVYRDVIKVKYRFMDSEGKPVQIIPLEDKYGIHKAEEEIDGEIYTCFYTTCNISKEFNDIKTSTYNDKFGGFLGGVGADASEQDKESYRQYIKSFKDYDSNAVFDFHIFRENWGLSGWTNDDEDVTQLKWNEYSLERDLNGNIKPDINGGYTVVTKEYRADSWLENSQNTKEWINGTKNPLYVYGYTPQEVKSYSGTILKGIPAGYGFSFAFQETYNGNSMDLSGGYPITPEELAVCKDACTMFQNGIILYPEYNYDTAYAGIIETKMDFNPDHDFDCAHFLEHNPNSLNSEVLCDDIKDMNDVKSRVHFIPVWYPVNSEYKIEVIMFDYWTPAGQIFERETYTLYVDGTIYDNWYVTKSSTNQRG